MKAQRFFWPLYLVLLIGAALAGSEAIASFIVPSWPARDMRPIEVDLLARGRLQRLGAARPAAIVRASARTCASGPSWWATASWKASSCGRRCRLSSSSAWPRPARPTWRRSISASRRRGRATTTIASRTSALALKPDAIVLAVYAGNDFVSTPFGGWMRPPIAELPLPSLLARPGAAHDLARRQPPRPLGVRPQQQGHRRRIRPAERMAQAAGG